MPPPRNCSAQTIWMLQNSWCAATCGRCEGQPSAGSPGPGGSTGASGLKLSMEPPGQPQPQPVAPALPSPLPPAGGQAVVQALRPTVQPQAAQPAAANGTLPRVFYGDDAAMACSDYPPTDGTFCEVSQRPATRVA